MEKVKFSYNDYSPKEQYEKFGIYTVDFMPFENQDLDEYNPKMGLSENEYIAKLKEYQYSTVYKGIRYYFKTPKQLKSFCEIVEANND
jgi:hypothetical protein